MRWSSGLINRYRAPKASRISPDAPNLQQLSLCMSPQATYSQKRAAEFLAYLLDTVDVRPALKHFNIKDKRYVARLKAKLRETFSLADAPRPGRKPKYTEEQVQLAVRVLSEARPIHSSAALVSTLQERQVLPEKVKHRGFLPAFKRGLGQLGLKLAYGRRRKSQPLTDQDKQQRLTWCEQNRTTFTEDTVQDWWFTDETSISTGVHPKGERGWSEWVTAAASQRNACPGCVWG